MHEHGINSEVGESLQGGSNIVLPHAEVALDLFEDYVGNQENSGMLTETVAELLKKFSQTEINNIALHTVKSGIAFPYTRINVTDVARSLYLASGHQSREPQDEMGKSDTNEDTSINNSLSQSPRRRLDITFGSFYGTSSGSPFTFVEYAMDNFMKTLPTVLNSLQRGEEPDDIEIITLGSPTNLYGIVNDEWAADFEGQEFEKFAQLYADLIRGNLAQTTSARRTDVQFTGLSGGVCYAVATAHELLSEHIITQDKDVTDIPRLQVLADSPAGFNESYGGPIQNTAGFGFDMAFQLVTNKAVRQPALAEKKFLSSLEEILKGKGITIHMDEHEKELKERLIKQQANRIRYGEPFGQDVKINARVGLKDATLYSRDRKKAAEDRLKEVATDDIRRNSIPSGHPNIREFAINMTHVPPWFRDGELRKWANTALYVNSMMTEGGDIYHRNS